MARADTASRVIAVSLNRVYAALVDAEALTTYLFLLVTDGRKQVRRLHDAIYREVLRGALRPSRFVPHMTVGRQAEDAALRVGLNEAAQTRLSGAGHAPWRGSVKGDGARDHHRASTDSDWRASGRAMTAATLDRLLDEVGTPTHPTDGGWCAE